MKEQTIGVTQNDEVLDHCDWLIGYFAGHCEKAHEMLNRIIISLSQMKSLNFSKTNPTAEENHRAKSALEQILKHSYCQKKRLFSNVNKKIEALNLTSSKDLQIKYERLLAQLNLSDKGKNSSLETKYYNLLPQDSQETTSKKFHLDIEDQPNEINGLNRQVLDTIENCQKMIKTLKASNSVEVDFLNCKKLFQMFQEFQLEFQNAAIRLREKLMIVSEPEFSKVDFDSNFKSFMASLEVIKTRNSEFEKFAYSKLFELREQSTQLMIVQNHINKYFKKFVARK